MVCRAESMTIGDEERVVVMHEAKGSQTLEDSWLSWRIHVVFDKHAHHAEK